MEREKPKLLELLYEYSGDDINLEEKNWHDARHLLKIFDVYAVEFADWLKSSGYIIELFKGSRQTEKILEIFKKEKGL